MTDISRFTLPMYASRNTTIAGIGVIHGYSVGSCSHTCGFDMHFLAAGADQPAGHVSPPAERPDFERSEHARRWNPRHRCRHSAGKRFRQQRRQW